MRTTLKDIAKYLNVSTTTVSRALNDKEDISSTMRQRVLEVARIMDYKPNSVAISLRKKTTSNLIGVIMPVVDHYFFSTILRGITASEIRDDHMIMIGETNHDVEREKELINRMGDHYVAGIIFIPSRNKHSIDNVKLLQSRRTPFILIDRIFKDFNGSFIQHDDFHGAYAAVDHLIKRGNKTIGMLRGSDECSISQARYEGYKSALSNAGIKHENKFVVSCIDASKKEGYEAAEYLKQESSLPDALFCLTDQLAAGVLSYSRDCNISIPEDLSIVGYSNSEIAQNLTPKLTTVAQDGYEMGRLAKEYLIEMCHHDDVLHQKIFSAELIVRDSS